MTRTIDKQTIEVVSVIERRPGNALASQGIDQRLLIDNGAARDIDQKSCWPECCQHVRRNQMAGCLTAGASHHEKVTPLGERLD